jgi:hypothetical protein
MWPLLLWKDRRLDQESFTYMPLKKCRLRTCHKKSFHTPVCHDLNFRLPVCHSVHVLS